MFCFVFGPQSSKDIHCFATKQPSLGSICEKALVDLQGSGSIFGYRVKCARIERALRSELSPCAELAEVKLCPKSARDAPWLCHEKQKRMGGDMPHLPPMTIQYFEYLKSWSIGLDHFIWANGGDPNTKSVAESLFCTFGMPKNTKAETKNTQ